MRDLLLEFEAERGPQSPGLISRSTTAAAAAVMWVVSQLWLAVVLSEFEQLRSPKRTVNGVSNVVQTTVRFHDRLFDSLRMRQLAGWWCFFRVEVRMASLRWYIETKGLYI